MPSSVDEIRSIKRLDQLITYLRDELDWPIDSEEVANITFDYTAQELGLKEEYTDLIKEIKQIRPLASNQPWGIFFVNFKKKRLPVVGMRHILRALVFKKRHSANTADRMAWQPHDLLFISAYGEEHDRAVTFAHFVEQPQAGLAELRVLGWDDDDTPLHMDYVARMLREKLRWDDNLAKNPDAWRTRWSDAFLIRHQHVIRTSAELAATLAALAKRLRARVRTILRLEDTSGEMRRLQKAFRDGLIHDLDDEGFADMFAQTVTYGLFSVSVRRTIPGEGTAIVKDDVPNLIFTSPFLKEMLGVFLGIKSRKGEVDFDQLGISDVTDLLTSPDTHMEVVLADFNNRNRGEDPVIHFYEDFLKAYDSEMRVKRGVFYTPQPVVSYIVRSVHELLQTEFGLEDGLASTVTWREMLQRHKDLKLPTVNDPNEKEKSISPDEPFVQILDPAVGTATFLVEVIDVIYRTLTAKWKKEGRLELEMQKLWNEYVPKHLLPRLHGYELLAAPYAIAHLKLGLKLTETGYRFGSDERARIYLTNALEPKVKQLPQIGFEPLAHEAQAVNEIKWYKRFTVVIGNPPYSQAKGRGVIEECAVYKRYRSHVADERRSGPLSNDYVRFVATAQQAIEMSGAGVLGMITSSSFLESIVHRGMRYELLQLSPLYCLDLHGETLPGRPRETEGRTGPTNVFDIQEGVAITMGVHGKAGAITGELHHHELKGGRLFKYEQVDAHTVSTFPWFKFQPSKTTGSLFSEVGAADLSGLGGFPLPKVFDQYTTGITTFRDHFAVALSRDELLDRLRETELLARKPAEFAKRFELEDGRGLNIRSFLATVAEHGLKTSEVRGYVFAPFDHRFIWYRTDLLGAARADVAIHLLKPNIALLTTRQTKEPFGALATRLLPGHKCIAKYEGTYFAPLYLNGSTVHEQQGLFETEARTHNFTAELVKALAGHLHLKQAPNGFPDGISPEDIFHYAYAVLYSPSYRSRYAEFLKIDFPRLPLTGNLELFGALARLGGELVALHLLESPKLDHLITEYLGGRAPEVEKVSWSKNTVWLDKDQTTGFKGVREDVWNFHIGGYQVCEKWLKDRRGRTLSANDRSHYQKIVVALSETIRLMAEIDAVIEKYGGWPLK